MTIKHETFTFARTLKHPPARVFQAFTNNAELEKWSPPDEGMNMRIHEGTAASGARLIWSCGPGESEGVRVVSDYYHLDRDRALLFSEAIYHQDALLSAAMVTVTFSGGDETALEVRAQVAAIDHEMLGGYEHGWGKALENLEVLLGS